MELTTRPKKLLEFIENAGGKFSLLNNKAICKALLNSLNSDQIEKLQHLLEQDIKAVGEAIPGRIAANEEEFKRRTFSETHTNCLPIQRCYLYWKRF